MTGVVNRLLGITPTLSGWGTNPDNLDKATDDDWSTSTGTGSKTLTGAGTVGRLHFDMGVPRSILVLLKVGIWSSAGSCRVSIWYSNDGSTWYSGSGYYCISSTSTSEAIRYSLVEFRRARHIRVRFYVNAAATAYAKIYEVQALEFPQVAGGG